jgi:hypothetical protein
MDDRQDTEEDGGEPERASPSITTSPETPIRNNDAPLNRDFGLPLGDASLRGRSLIALTLPALFLLDEAGVPGDASSAPG